MSDLETRAGEQLTAAPSLTLVEVPAEHVLIVAGLLKQGLRVAREAPGADTPERAMVVLVGEKMLRHMRRPFEGMPDLLEIFDGGGW